MRALRIAGAGALLAFGLFGLSVSLDRPYSFILIFLATCAVVLSVGLVLSAGITAWTEGQWWFIMKRLYHVTIGSPKQHHEPAKTCTSCHRPMSEVHFTWVCESCDHVRAPA